MHDSTRQTYANRAYQQHPHSNQGVLSAASDTLLRYTYTYMRTFFYVYYMYRLIDPYNAYNVKIIFWVPGR